MEKYFRPLFICLLSCFIISCTSKKKEFALDEAKAQFRSDIEKEADDSITGHKNLKEAAINIIIESAAYEIESIDEANGEVFAVVHVKALDPKIRANLFEIINKLDEWKEKRFNIPDAIGLIGSQMKLDPNIGVQFKIAIKKKMGD